MLLIDRRQRAQRREMRANATTLDRLLIRMWAANDFTVPSSEVQWLKATARQSDVPLVRTIALRVVGWATVGGMSDLLPWWPCSDEDLRDCVSILEEAAGSEHEAHRREAEVALERVRRLPHRSDPGHWSIYADPWTGPPQTLLSERRQSMRDPFPSLVTGKEIRDRCRARQRDGASEESFRWLMAIADRYKGLWQEWTAVKELCRLWHHRSWTLRLRPRALDPLRAEVVRFTCSMLEDKDWHTRACACSALADSSLCHEPRIHAALRRCCHDDSTAVSSEATRAMLADVWK